MSKKQRFNLIRILAAFALFIGGLIISAQEPQGALFYSMVLIYCASYLIVGADVVWGAVRNIFRGKVFDEKFLMSLATVGAFILGNYPEGILVMLLYQVGEWFQSYAVGKSRRSIGNLMDIRPDYANRILPDGSNEKVSPEEIVVGEEILVKAGERVPLDGVIIDGFSSIDTSSLTGESLPREVGQGDEIISGCINLTGVLRVKVSREFAQSTVAKILDLVENQSEKKAKSEKFITRFAKYYTPAVCLAALFFAVGMPLITDGDFSKWVYRALTFLVISCPCALVISIPLSFFGGIGGASKAGVLVKGANYIEALSNAELFVFDKTGTLTQGRFEVVKTEANNISEDELLELAAHAEIYSNHPVALSIKNKYGREPDASKLENISEQTGYGIEALYMGKQLLAGNLKLMQKHNIAVPAQESIHSASVIHVALNGKYKGYLLAEDTVKPGAKEAISELKSLGVKRTFMLTGDAKTAGERVAAAVGIDEVHTGLLPAEKVEAFEDIISKKQKYVQKGMVAYVGDGVNDAPVLARADVGIAMGGLGSDAAIEAADVVIMDDSPEKIGKAIRISRKTVRIANQNIVLALGIKFIFLLLSAAGYTSMWAAIFADVGVSLMAILNAIRALRVK